MESIRTGILFFIFFFVVTTSSYAQTTGFDEIIKKHINETVQEVKGTEDPDKKRQLLNDSFDKILLALDEVKTRLALSDAEAGQLDVFKSDILEKTNQLNGLEGFAKIRDGKLDEFSEYTQQDLEQADRFITISVSTAILVILLLLLL